MKIKFMNDPIVKPLPDGVTWEFAEDWFVEIGSHMIKVPKGFICDFASIPRFFWRYCGAPATGKHRRAAVLHDFLYASEFFDRCICDNIFYQVMRMDGVSWFLAKMMYLAVCSFGGIVWNNHNKKEVEALRCDMA